MKKNTLSNGIALILSVLLGLTPSTSIAGAPTHIKDPLSDDLFLYEDFPEVLKGEVTGKALHDLLTAWPELDPELRESINKYFKDLSALPDKQEKLRSDREKKRAADLDYQSARDTLKKWLLAAFGRLGLQTLVAMIDAWTDVQRLTRKGAESDKEPAGDLDDGTQKLDPKTKKTLEQLEARMKKINEAQKKIEVQKEKVAQVEARIEAVKKGADEQGARRRQEDLRRRQDEQQGQQDDQRRRQDEQQRRQDEQQRQQQQQAQHEPPSPDYMHRPGRFLANDPDDLRFRADGLVERGRGYHPEGEVAMSLKTKLPDGTESRALKGHKMFAEILEYFRGDFGAIRARWEPDLPTNLDKFNELTAAGVPPKQAALQTWTGDQAKRHGYTGAEIRELQGTPGKYTKVEVTFFRPENPPRID